MYKKISDMTVMMTWCLLWTGVCISFAMNALLDPYSYLQNYHNEGAGIIPIDGLKYLVNSHYMGRESALMGGIDGFEMNYGGIIEIGIFFHYIFGDYSVFAISGFNFIITVLSIINFGKILNIGKRHRRGIFLFLVVAGFSPYIFVHNITLTKEPVTIFLVSLYFLSLVRKSYLGCIVSLLLLFAIRYHISIFLAVSTAVTMLRVHPVVFIVLASIILPMTNIANPDIFFGLGLENRENISSRELMYNLYEIQSSYFGFIITAPVKLLLSIGAPFLYFYNFLSNLLVWHLMYAFYGGALLASFAVFFRNCFRGMNFYQRIIINCAMLMSLIPFMQPRYYIFFIPLFITFSVRRVTAGGSREVESMPLNTNEAHA